MTKRSVIRNINAGKQALTLNLANNVDMECSECMAHFDAQMKDACPERDEECRMQE